MTMHNLLDQNSSENTSKNHNHLSDDQVIDRIRKLKEELKDEVVILGHHYQQDSVIQFADYRGDSLKLAKDASKLDKPYIIFCGVHFMAETADMLSQEHQKVILPDLDAGCSMADMANTLEINRAWNFIAEHTDQKIIPITYINCTAELKAFVGDHEGSICTSSNAKSVIKWALDQGEKLLFFPDQHLGRNSCFELGVSLDEMVIYNPNLQNGGLTPKEIQNAKVILWYGYCSVHEGFTKEQITKINKADPKMKVIVHPECSFDVTSNSDLNGSTSFIIDVIKKSPPGSSFAVGTEINLVNRIANEFSDKNIVSLSQDPCLCPTMYAIKPRGLLTSLESIKEKKAVNVISVDSSIKKSSIKALERMLKI